MWLNKISPNRIKKIDAWLSAQEKKNTFSTWGKDELANVDNWSKNDKFGYNIRCRSEALYLKYLAAVLKRKCIQNHGQKKGTLLIKKNEDRFKDIEKFIEDTKFHIDNL